MNDNAYALRRTVPGEVADVIPAVTQALAAQGFGVLTTIDVQATLKTKLDRDVEPYVILGACNPQLAHRGLEIEPDLGVLLPCNVVVRRENGNTVVSAMDPAAGMAIADNPALGEIATQARSRIAAALDAVSA